MKLSTFTNQSKLSKTLRFRLIPQGNTLENFKADRILEGDKKRASDYPEMKRIMDDYHKHYIENQLSKFAFESDVLLKIAEYYSNQNHKNFEVIQAEMMKLLSKALKEPKKDFDELFKEDLISKTLPSFIKNDDKRITTLNTFDKFTTYFQGYYSNRKNMYSCDGKSTEICYRVVKQNLPKFLDNIKVWEKISNVLPQEIISDTDNELYGLVGLRSCEIFKAEAFNEFISQSGIDRFNNYIGGYTTSDGKKIQGLNEKINLYSQKAGQKLPYFKPLFKQILSDRESVSFIPEEFKSDSEILADIDEFYKSEAIALSEMHDILSNINYYNTKCIYIKNGIDVSDFSNIVYGTWNAVKDSMLNSYEKEKPYPKDSAKIENYEKKRDSYLKTIKSISITEIENIVNEFYSEAKEIKATNKIIEKETVLYSAIKNAYMAAKELIENEYPTNKKLCKDDESIEKIKSLLDSIKEYHHFAELFCGSGSEADKDSVFYGAFEEVYTYLSAINRFYDKVRNYMTKKPYSSSKIRLMLNRGDFLKGWAKPTEWNNKEAHLIEKCGKYYLFITSRTLKEDEWKKPLYNKSGNFEKSDIIEYYFQKVDNKQVPRLFIRTKEDKFSPNIEAYDLPINDVIEIYDKGYFKTSYRDKNPVIYRESLTKLIDYFKLGFSKHDSYKCFSFNWKNSTEYADISEFYLDTMACCYRLEKSEINFDGLMSMVDDGKGYLFEIYSKDFSEFSHGKPNLHTLYFKALFEENSKIRLQGDAEMFFREKSLRLSDTAIHPKNVPIRNKNARNAKDKSVFEYDLIKDKRYTRDHFELHLPIELNWAYGNINGKSLNIKVLENLKADNNNYIIGIDRGERNLLYVSVIDSNGKIVEQESLNIIGNTDYHAILNNVEESRTEERKKWKTIEGIKEAKEGYLSQAIHKICLLVKKYNAVIALENLNSGFKNVRSGIEKSIYQKFEKMLCDKLNYMTSKDSSANEPGGYMNGYQLADTATSYNNMRGQNGIIFYIPAWLTSKIDPTTGFANLLRIKYESVQKAIEFLKKFDSIKFNETTGLFEFELDYAKFQYASVDFKKRWTVCSYGDRIYTHRNSQNLWVSEKMNLTSSLIDLFEKYGIDYHSDTLQEAIYSCKDRKFFDDLLKLISLMLQMRNSVTGTEVDYLISPVRNKSGDFFDSRRQDASLPLDADANGAYNIARKVLWIIEQLKKEDNVSKFKCVMTNAQWLEYAQAHND